MATLNARSISPDRLPRQLSRLVFNVCRYIINGMIKTFATKETAALFANEKVRKLPPEILQVARRKLVQLHHVSSIEELRIPPGNRLEKLSSNRDGQWSIRINDQWRICFRFEAGDAFDVEIIDYH